MRGHMGGVDKVESLGFSSVLMEVRPPAFLRRCCSLRAAAIMQEIPVWNLFTVVLLFS